MTHTSASKPARTSLERIHVFRDLPREVLLELATHAVSLEARNGTEIFQQGDNSDAVYAIVGGEGRIRIGVIDRRSKKLMVEVFGLGDIFGEISVIDAGTRTATAVVDGRVRLMRINSSAFMTVLGSSPALGIALAKTLAQRLRRTFELFQDATFETLEVRLARQLLYLSTIQGRPDGRGIVLGVRLRQSDLADLLGATTRSIITILNTWRSEDIVHYDADKARVTIGDKNRLEVLVGATSFPHR